MRPTFLLLGLAAAVCAQEPRIGVLDFYGLRKVSEGQVRKALGVKEGDPLPRSKGDAEERLTQVPGVVEAHLTAVCCEDGKTILYVGIEERGAVHFDLRDTPEGEMVLPEEMIQDYQSFLDAVQTAVQRGNSSEDLTKGHSLMADPDARAVQEKFIGYAGKHLSLLRDVLRNAADDHHRAVAAMVIAYAPKKSEVVNDLQYALKDPDSTVRNNAMRALAAFAVLERLNPQSEVRVSPTWFIEMLNSLSWTDRNKALMNLGTLTESRDAPVLAYLRERALPALIDMARWKSLSHALPAFVILGRVAGVKEEEIHDAWNQGQRERIIRAATNKAANKRE